MASPTDEALERAYRGSFGRLVGSLFRSNGDLQLSEDAVASAFTSAVSAWRAGGIPEAPEAWLRVVARNHALTALRKRSRTNTVAPEVMDGLPAEAETDDGSDVDERLALLMVCAHPAIDPRMHAPLMLQAVLGVDAARIASVYLVPASTMGQRLSRSKAKIRDAGLRYRVPDREELPGRLQAVLQAVYGAYGLADPIADAEEDRDVALRAEAIRLVEVITDVLPDEPEPWGLLALLRHTESRRPGRFVDGEFVPLPAQDTRLWSPDLRVSADDALRRAAGLGGVGRFQIEAAISAVHSARADRGTTDHGALVTLYRGLLRVAPSTGATIGAAAAFLAADDVDGAVRTLGSIPSDQVATHQPYWVCRAQIDRRRGDDGAAREAAERAIGLTADSAVRRYLIAEWLRG
ncbi:RNA polymerase sigma factor [Microbacterium sp. P01]|uniref:RNA polymerase sigma factor n=1 Tax=unclassified Microbacterium TaxID=2609290 RepID=UPI00366F325D